MKIIRGGGGIDEDGNWYTLPREEVEVPDDFFQELWSEIAAAPQPSALAVPQWAVDLLDEEIAKKD